MICATLCREGKHCDLRIHFANLLCAVSRRNDNVGELIAGGIRNNRAIGEDVRRILFVFEIFGRNHYETAWNRADAGSGFDNLECCSRYVCGAEHRAAHNAVYVAAFQRYARIEHVVCRDDVERLLFGHAFCFAKFVKSVCILCSVLACLGIVKGYARKIDFGKFGFDFLFVADENDFANVLLSKNFRCFCRTHVGTLCKRDRFGEFACSAHKVFNKLRHIKLLKCCTLIANVLFLVIIIST